jgi:hypothetical protein
LKHEQYGTTWVNITISLGYDYNQLTKRLIMVAQGDQALEYTFSFGDKVIDGTGASPL